MIGPAGERGADTRRSSPAATTRLPRLGLGAVMGGKRVKADRVGRRAAQGPRSRPARPWIAADYRARMYGNQLTAWQHGSPASGLAGRARVRAGRELRRHPNRRGGVDPASAPALEGVAGVPGPPHRLHEGYGGAAVYQEALAALGANIGVADPGRYTSGAHGSASTGLVRGHRRRRRPRRRRRTGASRRPGERPRPVRVGRGRRPAPARRPNQAYRAMTSKDVELPPFDPFAAQPGLGYAVARSAHATMTSSSTTSTSHPTRACRTPSMRYASSVWTCLRARGVLDPTGTATLMRLWGLTRSSLLVAATPTRPCRWPTTDRSPRSPAKRPTSSRSGRSECRGNGRSIVCSASGFDRDTLPDRFFTEPVAAG